MSPEAENFQSSLFIYLIFQKCNATSIDVSMQDNGQL